MEAGRTEGRSKAKDCADGNLLVSLATKCACAVAARRSGPRRKRPPTPRAVFMLSIVFSDAQTSCASRQFPGNCGAVNSSRDLFAFEGFEAWSPRHKRKLLAVFKDSELA
jgi:hypothetical protein